MLYQSPHKAKSLFLLNEIICIYFFSFFLQIGKKRKKDKPCKIFNRKRTNLEISSRSLQQDNKAILFSCISQVHLFLQRENRNRKKNFS